MGKCNHEEADTRIIVHVRHALEGGAESVLVRTVDTDVVIILVDKFHDLVSYNPRGKIFVAFGVGRYYSVLDINWICSTLGESKSRSLPVFHAFTGCDTTCFFCNVGKLSAWQTWESNPELTTVLEHLAAQPFQ